MGSFNLPKYVIKTDNGQYALDYPQFRRDIEVVVRAMDNVIDRTVYPLPEQEQEAKSKRRMGLGVTGAANALEMLGLPYGTDGYLSEQDQLLEFLAVTSYQASINLAKERGSFPLLDRDRFVQSGFMSRMPQHIVDQIIEHGIRNSHLTSIAPTGTISLTADNVSSGIEPPFTLEYQRTIQTFEGPRIERVQDYAKRFWNVEGRTADQITASEHVEVLCAAQKWVDSACSKTCNVGSEVTFEEFKNLYRDAFYGGAKGITTFRAAGKRFGILEAVVEEPEEADDHQPKAEACTFDPVSGNRTCDN